MSNYILDACALLAVLNKEKGAEQVKSIIEQATTPSTIVRMNAINLLEVYYGILRESDKQTADDTIRMVRKSAISIKDVVTRGVFQEAGRLKARYRISLADSIALAEASVSGCSLVTSDHHEFDIIEESESIKFFWFR